jgi:hypothetical protein
MKAVGASREYPRLARQQPESPDSPGAIQRAPTSWKDEANAQASQSVVPGSIPTVMAAGARQASGEGTGPERVVSGGITCSAASLPLSGVRSRCGKQRACTTGPVAVELGEATVPAAA